MKQIKTEAYQIIFEENFNSLKNILKKEEFTTIFILVDENTKYDCLPILTKSLPNDFRYHLLEIRTGEKNKTLATCVALWRKLSIEVADRKSLLINLGGGVVTDLGGFVASTFMRGIAFINIPTSLLAMVDASVGGKTGVNLDNLKNQIGVFNNPKHLIINNNFLKTLPQREWVSGFAEILKHGLVFSIDIWRKTSNLTLEKLYEVSKYIFESIEIKHKIIKQDFKESGKRKILNFGHTLGHAIESYFLNHKTKPILLHGEAIAIGMILESFIAYKKNLLSEGELEEITTVFLRFFSKVTIEERDHKTILQYLIFDKKNNNGIVKFVLLSSIGTAIYDYEVNKSLIIESFNYYKKLQN